MHVVYARDPAPETFSKSIFLVGPTPRDKETDSWRPAALEILRDLGYDGVVFIPEPGSGKPKATYIHQVGWERDALNMSDVIVAWVPRELDSMPGFTTNVEFGRYVTSGKLVYGRPKNAPRVRYLDWLYKDAGWGEPKSTLGGLMAATAERLGSGAERTGGERNVPLHIWRTPMFQEWIKVQQRVGNRLDGAELLWHFVMPKARIIFAYVMKVNVWIEDEKRHKSNDIIFGRSDISVVAAYAPAKSMLDTKILFIREFRSPVRNEEGFVRELAGGSSFKQHASPLSVAADELEEETGIKVLPDRFEYVGNRQLVSTLSTHHAHLFAVQLTKEEMEVNAIHGNEEDSERTYVEVTTLRHLLDDKNTFDWSMLGMIASVVIRRKNRE